MSKSHKEHSAPGIVHHQIHPTQPASFPNSIVSNSELYITSKVLEIEPQEKITSTILNMSLLLLINLPHLQLLRILLSLLLHHFLA